MPPADLPVLALRDVTVRRAGRPVLDRVDWEVRPGERWVVLGPNGSGKTTLLHLAAALAHPSAGSVDVLGQRLGRVDVRTLRPRVGLTSAALADALRPELTAVEAVMTARHGALEPWWHTYSEADRAAALERLAGVGAGAIGERRIGTLSSGERQRVLLARALAGGAELLLLDEPAAGLDLGGREELVDRLARLAADTTVPPIVFVTHHVEEIPPGFGHVLLLRDGRVHAAGPIGATLTGGSLSACFGVPVRVVRDGARWAARHTGA